jgi:RNA polymerase sigma-70 factor (ECF subfamily)
MEERLIQHHFDVNDEKNVDLLIELYSKDVYKVAYFYVKDQGKAEDITQEVFLTCFEKLKDFRGDFSQIKHWLLKITSNKAKDYLKSWAYKYMTLSNSFIETMRSKEPLQESILMKKHENAVLAVHILNLPIKYREVILLYYYQELKIHEIADLLNTNENSVKTRLRRGKDKLRSLLKGEII